MRLDYVKVVYGILQRCTLYFILPGGDSGVLKTQIRSIEYLEKIFGFLVDVSTIGTFNVANRDNCDTDINK